MNKQELYSAFESLNPTEEQKQRMLDNIMAQKSRCTQKAATQIWKKVYIPACSMVAAALMLAVVSGVLAPGNVTNDTYLTRMSEQGATNAAVVSQYKESDKAATYSDETDSIKKALSPQDEKVPEYNKSTESIIAGNTSNKNEVKTDGSGPELEIIPGEVATFALNINTASVPLRSRFADEEKAPAEGTGEDVMVANDKIGAVSAGGLGASGSSGGAATVTYGEFCHNIGFDIKTRLMLPHDMRDITDEQVTLLGSDSRTEWDLVYQGNDNRILTINISRDIDQNMQYFENDSFIKTDFSGTHGVVIYDGLGYTSYINDNDIAYVVNTNITEAELTSLLLSMTSKR